jgi:hypothetical protein
VTLRDVPWRQAVRRAIFEMWDSRERRHATLGYVSPVEYEARHQAA